MDVYPVGIKPGLEGIEGCCGDDRGWQAVPVARCPDTQKVLSCSRLCPGLVELEVMASGISGVGQLKKMDGERSRKWSNKPIMWKN